MKMKKVYCSECKRLVSYSSKIEDNVLSIHCIRCNNRLYYQRGGIWISPPHMEKVLWEGTKVKKKDKKNEDVVAPSVFETGLDNFKEEAKKKIKVKKN